MERKKVNLLKQIAPPIIWNMLELTARKMTNKKDYSYLQYSDDPSEQDLSVYYDPKTAQALESWGEGNAWNEIQFLMSACSGKVLDIACGTGKTIEINSRFPDIELYGCDISDFLLKKAIERGVSANHLKLCDATKTDYEDNYFQYSYSIGSLEHFTAEGIDKFIQESYRITQKSSFHMMPVSRRNQDEGWIKNNQSYYNNSVDWWLKRFKKMYLDVYVLESSWQDEISLGRWFVCTKF
jgi:ubiquinone/menaquinone biosynthesis C-methylase UbiE